MLITHTIGHTSCNKNGHMSLFMLKKTRRKVHF